MSDVQQIIHGRIVRESKYGVDDDYTAGLVAGLSFALHRIVERDGENRTGCKEFDLKEENA
ncbi:hypothetical protein [Bifidobacterium callitrichos]|uniref:Phage protein n=1 Tax=Bifidobacterium callitrichos DSM 23973 TaxID=1437609 RepID=A0A087ACR5_9BIFI|nr:hypothetical protein [Bifidobacterium callitrichos]KFI56565.1 hypothetical protein BCAL_0160 [Bifidobacterium callitrichos DSM 23973]